MSPIFSAALAAALVIAGGPAAQSPTPAQPGPTPPRAEAALVRCWAKEVTAACTSRRTHDESAVEGCKAERAKTACATERAAYEKELAAGLASDALELLVASIKHVCVAEAAATQAGKLREQERALAAGWHEALDVRSEFMKACETTGRDARDCDERANEAERMARTESCPLPR